MASLDASAVGTTTVASPVTVPITSNGVGNRVAVVIVEARIPGGTATVDAITCTYAGVAMTRIATGNDGSGPGITWAAFALANPATGAQNVVASDSTNPTSAAMNLAVYVFTGAAVPDASLVAHSRQLTVTTASQVPVAPGASDYVVFASGSDTAGAGYTSNTGLSAGQVQTGIDDTGNFDFVAGHRPGSSGAAAMTQTLTSGNTQNVTVTVPTAVAAASSPPPSPLLVRLSQFFPLRAPILGFPLPAAPATAATTPVSSSIDAPFESLGAVVQAGVEPSESVGVAATTSTLPLEAGQGVVQVGNADPVEAGQGVATAALDPLESAGGVAASGLLPLESVQALAGQQSTLPLEAGQGVTATGAPDPVEAGQGVAQTGSEPAEAAAGVASLATDPLETTSPASTVASAPYEAAQGVAAVGAADPVEAAGGVAQTGQEPLEALGAVASTGSDPIESLQAGVTPVSQALALALEALGTVAGAPTLPLEALMGGVVQAAADAIEALAGIVAAAVDAVESALGLTTSATDPVEAFRGVAQTGADPVEAAGGVAASPTIPFESVQQLAGATAQFPLESFLGAGTATASLPYDVLGALLSTGTTGFPVEALGFLPIPAPDNGGHGGGGFPPGWQAPRRIDDDEELLVVLDLLDLL